MSNSASVIARVKNLQILGRLSEAEQLLRGALAEDPSDAALLGMLGEVLLENEKYPEALIAADRAVAAAPSVERNHSLRAVSLAALGRHAEASEASSIAIGLDPHSTSSFIGQALVGYRCGDFEKGATAASQAIALDPHQVDGYLHLAQCRHGLGDEAGARQAIDEVLRLEPDNVLALQRRAALDLDAFKVNDALRGMTDVGILAPAESGRMFENLAAVAWHILLSPWMGLVATGLVVGIVTVIGQWSNWLTPSFAVRVTAGLVLTCWAFSLPRIRHSVPPHTRKALRLAIRRVIGLQIAIALLIAGLLIVVAVAVTGIGLWVVTLIPIAVLMAWLALHDKRAKYRTFQTNS